MSYGFDADRLLVWLAARDPDAEPLGAGTLCLRHADAMVVPRGWTLDDRRETTPRLFRTAPGAAAPARAKPARAPRRRPGTVTSVTAVADLEPADVAVDAAEAVGPTVAAVAGAGEQDPDATVAIPWLPGFGEGDDDLGGVLAAESPLLARAFRGADRPKQ
jgi:hypothetical protein